MPLQPLDNTNSPPATAPTAGGWSACAWFGALLLIGYAPVLASLAGDWARDDDMGHGFFVPVVAAYVAWNGRRALAAIPPAPSWWGVPAVAWGACQLFAATLGAELFLSRTSFLISLAGVVLLLGGFRWLRALAFPLSLLCLMIPIPAIIYSQITLPLQLLASSLAESVLALLGIPVLREGNILELASQRLSVVEACSGIRSLLSLSFLALVYGYLFDPKPWMRWVLLVMTVPISIAANAARVAVTGIAYEYDAGLAAGIFHSMEGWVAFMIALAMLLGVHKLVNRAWALRRRPA